MSIANYGELKTAVANFLTRDDLTARIPEFITLGEATLYTDLRCRENEATASVTITTSTRTSALPTLYVQARSIYISGTIQRLEYRKTEEYWSVYAGLTSAKPTVYTIEGENFVWGPLPDAGYTAEVLYYQRLAALSAAGDTNAVLTRWPNLYLWSSLLQSAPFLGNDTRILTWTAMYEDLLERIHGANARDRASGDAISERRAPA